MASGPSGSDNAPSDSRDSGSDDNKPDKAEFDRATDNANRPDRAPAAAPDTNKPDEKDDKPDRDNRPGGPEFGDTTPGYSGPTPDPRGPALDDNRPDDRQDNDKPNTPDPGGLPDGDTTPNYTGPNPDPRGPALGGGDGGEGTNKPDEAGKPEEESSFIDDAGSFFADLAQDIQDFARENPRVDSYGNPVGLVDADGFQRGEVYSRTVTSGMSPSELANHLGFDSPQEMAASQNTDFIEQKYQEDLQQRAIEAAPAVDERYGLHPDLMVINGLGPVITEPPIIENPQIIQAMQGLPPDKVVDAIKQAAELMPEIPPDVWARTEAIMKGALDGAVDMLGPAGVISQMDTSLPGPADLVAVAVVVAGGIVGGIDGNNAYESQQATIYEPNADHIFRDAPGHLPDTPENRALLEDTASNRDNFLGTDEFGNDWYAKDLDDGKQAWASVRNGEIRNGGVNETPKSFDEQSGLSRPSPTSE